MVIQEFIAECSFMKLQAKFPAMKNSSKRNGNSGFSINYCLPAIYLASTLVLSTLSVLFVILVINVHHTPDDEPMSDRLKSVALKMEKCICRRKRNESATQPVKVAPATE